MKVDLHIHTKYSPDGDIDPAFLLRVALGRGYRQLAITDHIDPPNDPYTPFDPVKFRNCRNDITLLQTSYPTLSVLFGAEVGEFHRNEAFVRSQFAVCPPELVIASIHMVNGANVSVPMPKYPTSELARAYYRENLEMLDIRSIDVLGHLGIYKRYIVGGFNDYDCKPLIDDILKKIIAKDIALEINTSGLKRPLRNLIPEPEVITRYKELGGKMFVLGSDSHTMTQFDQSHEDAAVILRKLGVRQIMYRNRNNWATIPL
jgi:histidinol-phosphatase (PHP family)